MKNLQALAQLPLFGGATMQELAALSPREREYVRGERILSAGGRCPDIGAVLFGAAHIVKQDAAGNPVTVARIGRGEMFAEAFAFSGEPLTVGAVAAENTRVVWLKAGAVLQNARFAAAALALFARKNIFLTERVEHLSKHTLREKVLSYLRSEGRGRSVFSVPFDRQGMADYLGCDRSALSALLSQMKREGVLDYRKNAFKFLR